MYLKQRSILVLLLASALLTALLTGSRMLSAQTFTGPQKAAPDNANLNSLDSLTNFLRSDIADAQALGGSLRIGAGQSVCAYVGSSTSTVAILGTSGAANPAPLPNLGITSAAIYGYAKGSVNSVGVYGYATSSAGVAITGRATTAAGWGGRFWGRAKIESGDLYVEDHARAQRVIVVSSDTSAAAVESTNGLNVVGDFSSGLFGEGTAWRGIVGETTVQSQDKAVSSGMYVANTINDKTFSKKNLVGYGLYGTTSNSTNYAGVFGWSTGGNGLEGANYDSTPTEATAVGQSDVRSQNCTLPNCVSSVFGRGDAWAGYFEGTFLIDPGYTLSIGGTLIDQTLLQKLLAWCNSGGKTYCPDPYQ